MKKSIYLLLLITFCLIPLITINGEEDRRDNAAIIPIKGEINKSLMVFLRRSIEKAKLKKVNHYIFEIDTFGGRVDSALQITTLIGSLDKAKTIAYIVSGPDSKGVSWSAGALISFSCKEIYMSPGTSIGAAAPVYQTKEGMEMAPEKVVSPVMKQFAALAEKNNHPKNIAMAMVDQDIELFETYVDDRLEVMTDDDIKELKRQTKGSKKIEIGKTIVARDKLLTLTAEEMKRYGVSKATVPSRAELLTLLGIEQSGTIEAKESSADQLIALLTSALVMNILVSIGLVAFYFEIRTPGFGIPGTIGIICFAVIFALNGLLGKVGSLELLMFLTGLILLILEIFVIPGFGVAGISGIFLILLSLVFSQQDFFIPSFSWQWGLLGKNFITISFGFILSLFMFMLLAQFLPKTPLFSPLTLKTEQLAEEGYTVQSLEQKNKFLNKKGTALTTLRPTGKAEIEGEYLEVQTDGEFLEKDTPIEVVDVTGNKIIVRKV